MRLFCAGFWRVACAAAFSCAWLPAYAQSSADPSHLIERFQPSPTPPSVGAPVEVPIPTHPTPPASASAVTFRLAAVTFTGNSVVPDADLQAVAAPYIGRTITLADAYEIAGDVTALYRRKGYILSRATIPAQRVSGGHLEIQIVEGFIDKVTVEGDAGGARGFLEDYGRRIAAIRPLTADTLERELLLAGDLAGMNVRSVLTASATVPGAADLTLVVSPKHIDGFLQVDDRGSRFLGPYEILGGVSVNDPFGTGGRLGFNGVVTPDSGPDLAYGGATWDQPIGGDGIRLFTNANYAATIPGNVLRTLDTQGHAFNASSALSYPFIRSRDLNLLGSLTFAAHEVQTTNLGGKPLYFDHIRSLSAQVFVDALDDWGGYSTLSASVTRGLPIFGATKASDLLKSRVGGSSDYTRANFEFTHDHPLFWRFALHVAAAGQTSFGEPLLAAEQFALGGDSYDRAFDPAEVTGDAALAGRTELRLDLPDQPNFFSRPEFFGFGEGGAVWTVHALPGTPASVSLASVGAGLRVSLRDRVNVDFEWAYPLDRDPAVNFHEHSRLLFTVGTEF